LGTRQSRCHMSFTRSARSKDQNVATLFYPTRVRCQVGDGRRIKGGAVVKDEVG
jgi:hypothetical protein